MRQAASTQGADGIDATISMPHKSRGEDGGNGGVDESEQSKARPDLILARITEKANIRWNDIAGLESGLN
jgi:hypothetical protein